MKSPRTWFPVLALLVLALFGTPAAHAALYCGDVCSCDVPCSTRCTEGGGLPILTCGQWYYELCAEKPSCSLDLVASSSAMTSNTSSGKADLLLKSIFAPAASMTR
jgi:hypothetical protein